MKKLEVLLVLMLTLSYGLVNGQGINFEHITLEEALQKAGKENKLVFVDVYTDWCGPCKVMTRTIFTNEQVGKFFNHQFINVKVNAEKEGVQAARKYGVDAYPTMIFLRGDGDMVYKNVGSKDIAGVILMGKNALEAVKSGYTIAELKEQYDSKRTDERFLKIYIEKMIENRENPFRAIEDWLIIQTEIKEDDVDMMEYLLNHGKYLMVDGKAEEILYANFDEYMDIATRAEERNLKTLKRGIIANTLSFAYQEKDPEMMRTFITNYKELSEAKEKKEAIKGYELDYLLMNREFKAYKIQSKAYLDSLINSISLAQIKADDKAAYLDYKKNKYRPSLIGNSRLKAYEKGVGATKLIRTIDKMVRQYSKHCTSKKSDYKQLYKWIDYGEQIIPDDYMMDNLRADILNKQGKRNEAIKYKELALNKLPERKKERTLLERQLEKMKSDKGE